MLGSNLVPRLFALTLLPRWSKDPGWGWSRGSHTKNFPTGGGVITIFFVNVIILPAAMLEYIAFFSCLQFAISNSIYWNSILKPKQVISLEHLYLNRDVICVLPTGYGKSLICHLLPWLLFAKKYMNENQSRPDVDVSVVMTIVIVVSPLNALISDQISRLKHCGIRASVLGIRSGDREGDDHGGDDPECDGTTASPSVECDFRFCDERKMRAGFYNMVFAHPESFISCKFGRELLLSSVYQNNVAAIVVDEAHCILEWYVVC